MFIYIFCRINQTSREDNCSATGYRRWEQHCSGWWRYPLPGEDGEPSGASEQEEAVYDEEIQDPVERERRRSGLGLCVSLRVLCVTVIFSLRFNKTCYYFMLFKIIFKWDWLLRENILHQATHVSSVHAKNNQICINLLIKMIHGYFDTWQ